MDLWTRARCHYRPELKVRQIDHGIDDGEAQSVLADHLWPEQLRQQHQNHELAARVNSIPHKHPAEIRAQGSTFALLHDQYTWGVSAHGQQSAQGELEVRALIGRDGRLGCRASQPSREGPSLMLM